MILSDKVTLTFDKRTSYDLREYQYELVVYNYNDEEALISLFLKLDFYGEKIKTTLIESEQLKIPHKLTAKQWMIKMILDNDESINNVKNIKRKENIKEELIRIKEYLDLENSKIKIKGF